MADRAIEKAVAIDPDAGEVRLARTYHLYCAYLDYDAARRELAIASRLLPNEPDALSWPASWTGVRENGKPLRKHSQRR